MRQNIASLVIDAETLKAIDGTLTALEKQLEDFIELSAEQVAFIEKLNPAFCERHVESAMPGEMLRCSEGSPRKFFCASSSTSKKVSLRSASTTASEPFA